MDTTMDAITKKRTLSGVIVTLLVGTAFAGLIAAFTPLAEATVTPTDATVDTSKTWAAGGYGTLNQTTPNLQYNHTYNLKFAFVNNSASGTPTTDTFKLCRPNSDNTTCDPTGAPTRGVTVTGQPGHINLTFGGIKLNATSVWYLVNDTGTSTGTG